MTISPSILAMHERRFQAVVVGGLVTVFAIVALTPHTERALFEEGRLPSAFAAVAVDPVTPLLRRFGVMEPTSFARVFRTGRPVGGPPATQTRLPGLVPPVTEQPPSFFAQPDGPVPDLVADAGVLGPQGGNPGFQNAGFTPGSGTGIIGTGVGGGADTPDPVATPGPEPTGTPTSTPTGTPTGTPSPTPSGTPTSTPPVTPPIVSPIPEPASWLMLLVGMVLVGITTRRARKGVPATA